MTTGHGLKSRRTLRSLGIIIFVGMLLLVVTAGGVVWRRPEVSSDTTFTAEGLVDATYDNGPCLPATDNFAGLSQTNSFITHGGAFQTCYQYGDEDKYCWTNSYSHISPIGGLGWYQCVPIGYGDEGWHAIEQRNMRYVNPPPVCPGCPYTCGESISVPTSVGGEPCQAQRRG